MISSSVGDTRISPNQSSLFHKSKNRSKICRSMYSVLGVLFILIIPSCFLHYKALRLSLLSQIGDNESSLVPESRHVHLDERIASRSSDVTNATAILPKIKTHRPGNNSPNSFQPAVDVGAKSGRAHLHRLISGVGLVTTDGAWSLDAEIEHGYKNESIKILGFTDEKYLSLARIWYRRLSSLGYTEHYLVAHDDFSYEFLLSENSRVIPCFISNPDYMHPVKGFWQQVMSARLHLTRHLLRNGTHLLITDVDNIFSRYVPLYGFLEEGYDVYHAYEMRYPLQIFNERGFVICSGHQFLRSTPATLRFMDLLLNHCGGNKCDDQVTYNEVFFHQLDIEWDNITAPNHTQALRVKSHIPENNGLLVESVSDRVQLIIHSKSGIEILHGDWQVISHLDVLRQIIGWGCQQKLMV